MQKETYKIEFSPEIISLITPKKQEVPQRVKEMVIIELFRERRISTGKAAQILGMKRIEFISLLSHLGIPYFQQDKEELSKEFSQA